MTTTTEAKAIILMHNARSRNESTGFVRPAQSVVFFVDDEGEEIGAKVFDSGGRAKARAYAIEASESTGLRLLGLGVFDAAV